MSPSEMLQNSGNSPDIVPCVVFAFNRPEKLQRILEALRPQNIDRLIALTESWRDFDTASDLKEHASQSAYASAADGQDARVEFHAEDMIPTLKDVYTCNL